MLKWIFLLMIIMGCTQSNELKSEVFIQKAKNCCSCHNGIYSLNFNTDAYNLVCYDGFGLSGKGPIETQYFNCGCN